MLGACALALPLCVLNSALCRDARAVWTVSLEGLAVIGAIVECLDPQPPYPPPLTLAPASLSPEEISLVEGNLSRVHNTDDGSDWGRCGAFLLDSHN